MTEPANPQDPAREIERLQAELRASEARYRGLVAATFWFTVPGGQVA